jgi:hypothetical protein
VNIQRIQNVPSLFIENVNKVLPESEMQTTTQGIDQKSDKSVSYIEILCKWKFSKGIKIRNFRKQN